jgi:hypothetical protein
MYVFSPTVYPSEIAEAGLLELDAVARAENRPDIAVVLVEPELPPVRPPKTKSYCVPETSPSCSAIFAFGAASFQGGEGRALLVPKHVSPAITVYPINHRLIDPVMNSRRVRAASSAITSDTPAPITPMMITRITQPSNDMISP